MKMDSVTGADDAAQRVVRDSRWCHPVLNMLERFGTKIATRGPLVAPLLFLNIFETSLESAENCVEGIQRLQKLRRLNLVANKSLGCMIFST